MSQGLTNHHGSSLTKIIHVYSGSRVFDISSLGGFYAETKEEQPAVRGIHRGLRFRVKVRNVIILPINLMPPFGSTADLSGHVIYKSLALRGLGTYLPYIPKNGRSDNCFTDPKVNKLCRVLS